MTMEKLALILFTFTLWNNKVVMGSEECTPPWMADSNPFLATIKSHMLYRCPSIFGDPKKEYCCYNSDGEVECCDYQQYLGYRFISLIPIIIIIFIGLSVMSCICYFLYRNCT